MDALILSCSTGGGHNSAAQAVAEELKYRGHNVVCMDPYELVGKNTASHIGNLYIKLVQKSPALFGILYFLGQYYSRLSIPSPVYLVNSKAAAPMKQYLAENHFDVIIMSHMYPAHILAYLKQHNTRLPKTFFIATDYTCIPLMRETSCDYYVIPSEHLSAEFMSQGFSNEQLLPFGIPVRKNFTIVQSKKIAREKLNLQADKTYILLSGGSIGAGNIKKAIHAMIQYLSNHTACNLIVICGNNLKLYQFLCKKYEHKKQLIILQSTTHMADFLHACDIFITKPGGLSSTEAAVSGIPLIHFSPIPGCETHNANFFAKHNMSIYITNINRQLESAVIHVQKEVITKQMLTAQHQCIDGMATDKLCDFLNL